MLHMQFGSVAANAPQANGAETVRLMRVDYGHYEETSNIYLHPVMTLTPETMTREQFTQSVEDAVWRDLQTYAPQMSVIREDHYSGYYYLARGQIPLTPSEDEVDRDIKGGLRLIRIRPKFPTLPEHRPVLHDFIHRALEDENSGECRQQILAQCAPTFEGQAAVGMQFGQALH